MANKSDCPVTCCDDAVTRTISKVGVNRSMLITLALLPFAWNGVTWVGNALHHLWNAATTAVNG